MLHIICDYFYQCGLFLTLYRILHGLAAQPRGDARRVAHVGVAVDLDQPDGEVLHQHEVSAVELEAVLTTVHRLLAGEQRADQALLHARVDQLVPGVAVAAVSAFWKGSFFSIKIIK